MPPRPLLRRLAAAPLLAVAGAGCGIVSITGPADRGDAARAVERWVAAHPTEWVVSLATAVPLARPAWSPPCSANPPSGFAVVRFEAQGTEIDLAFRCPIGPGAGDGAAVLQSRFAFVVLDRLPHGIRVPGWEFRVLTPSSSIASGVTFADVGGGRVRVTIETPLYAVYGRDTRPACEPPADGPMAPECWVSRTHAVPLRLTLVAPILAATLR